MYWRSNEDYRKIFQQGLQAYPGEGGKYVEYIYPTHFKDPVIEIVEGQTKGTGKLEKVIIEKLDDAENVQEILKIDMEVECKELQGITTKSQHSATEIALLVKREYIHGDTPDFLLEIFLIELKESVDPETLLKIEKKFAHTMNKIYTLLPSIYTINPEFKYTIRFLFKGIVFFNRERNMNSPEQSALSVVYNSLGQSQSGKLKLGTIMGMEVIPVKFFKNPKATAEMKITLTSLLKWKEN